MNKTVLSDGRIIEFYEFGCRSGSPVFFFHGAGAGSAHFAEALASEASDQNIRIIAPNRPGIGNSDFQKNRTLLNWAEDMSEFSKILKIPEYSIISESGGSPYALACAYLIPESIKSIAVVSGISSLSAPFDKSMLTFQNRIMLSMLKWSPRFLTKSIFQNIKKSLENDPETFFIKFASQYPEADRNVLRIPEYQDIFTRAVLSAFTQGLKGSLKDMQLVYKSWPFNIEDISVKVHLWHGEKDSTAPIPMAFYIKDKLDHAQLTSFKNDGHISVLHNHISDILKCL